MRRYIDTRMIALNKNLIVIIQRAQKRERGRGERRERDSKS